MTGLIGGRGGIDNLRIVAQYLCGSAPTPTPQANTAPTTFDTGEEDVTAPPSRERRTTMPIAFVGEEEVAAPQGGTMTFEPYPVETASDIGSWKRSGASASRRNHDFRPFFP